jgi:hypothetical protein
MTDLVDTLLPWLAPVLLGGVAGVLTRIGLRQRREAKATDSWPFVPGKVVATKIEAVTIIDHNGRRTVHRPIIRYTYEVACREYESSRLNIGSSDPSFQRPQDAEACVNRLTQGGKVKVYYHPDRPDRPVLIPGLKGIKQDALTVAFLFWVWSAIVVWALLRE